MRSETACRLRNLSPQLRTSLAMTTAAFATLAAVSICGQISVNAAISGFGSVTDLVACTMVTGDESAGSRSPTPFRRRLGSLDAFPGLCHVLNPHHDIDQQSGQ